MSISHSKMLIRSAKEAVAAASYCPRKLTAIHAGAAAGASILVTVLSLLLRSGISDAGGLSGIGTAALFQTAQSLLEILLSLLLPFWSMGFTAAAVHLARQQRATPHTLLTGLRRWGPALRLMILEAVIYFMVMLAAVQLGSMLYTMTPFSAQFQEVMQPLLVSGNTDPQAMMELMLSLDAHTLLQIFLTMRPFTVLPAVVVLVYVSYRLRLAQFILMDEPRVGAMYAVLMSFRLMRRKVGKLLRLDLRYWWFYALDLLLLAVCYGELALPHLGVTLPLDPALVSFLFYVAAMAGQMVLYVWKQPQVMTTYALFYEDLLPTEEPQAV